MHARPLRPLVLLLSASLALWGCAGNSKGTSAGGGTLAGIVSELPELRVPEGEPLRPSRAEALAAYEKVYGLIPDAADNHEIGKRLADLKMSVGEERDIEGLEDPYGDAVALYETLLENAEGEGRDQILYQLARAHDLVGETGAAVGYLDRLIEECPGSVYAVEARFRRAEIAFSAGEYRPAEKDYGFVVARGRETPYWQNATYMQGWARFKLGDLDQGLTSFFDVVDSLLGERSFEELPATEQELLTDSLRVVTLALAYLDGPLTLADHMRDLQRPDWQYEVYRALADDYLKDERFLDSVATWATFIDQNSRWMDSAQLTFDHDRLQREVMMRQQIVTSLSQSFEQARIDEVRDTPVITIVERPEAPVYPNPRNLYVKGLLGIVLGALLAVLWILGRYYLGGNGVLITEHSREFAHLKQAAIDDLKRPWRLLGRTPRS